MKRLALLAGVAVLLCFGRPAHAQGVFADVPADHWAYDAVNQLAAAGIFTGYPDQTFGGKRALTRYEFAVAIQRMLQDIQRRIEALGIPDLQRRIAALEGKAGPTGGASQADVDALKQQIAALQRQLDQQRAEQQRLQGAVDTLQRLVQEFRDTLTQLGADVEQLKRDLAALAQRVGRVEEAIAKMPKITGAVNIGFIGQRLQHPERFVGGPAPTDIDSRPISLDNSLLQTIHAIYDVDLGITARLSDVATAHVLLNAGNYLKGYLGNSISTVREVNDENTKFDQVTAYYAYLDTPISFGGFGAAITVGKFGQQFTPYTLKLVDVDSYFYNDKTDSGNYPILGGRVNFKIGGVNLQYYAGKHQEIPYADLTSTAGVEQPPFFTTHAPLFVGNPDVSAAILPPPSDTSVLDQSQGARLSFNAPLKSTIGVTWIEAAGSKDADRFRQLRVYGADLHATLWKFRVSGEVAESKWKNSLGQETSPVDTNEKRAWDARLGYRFGKIDVLGYYKRIGAAFDAPGYWGSIGRWKNPRNLEGYGGIATVPLGGRMAFDLEGAHYRFIGEPDTNLKHYRAGVKFSLTSTNRVDLGYERAEYEPPVGSNAREEYFNIGWGHDFSPTTSFKLLYQFIRFRVGSTGLNPLQDYDAQIAATQFSVRF